MLKNKMRELIEKAIENNSSELQLYNEEKKYLDKNEDLVSIYKDRLNLVEENSLKRFSDVYLERGNKETEEVIAVEDFSFLGNPVTYLKKNMEEFIYMESKWFELIGVEAVSFEVDDVFGTYDVMVGLKYPKKSEKEIRTYFDSVMTNSNREHSINLIFNQTDGMWDLNFVLDNLTDFHEQMSLAEAYSTIYRILFSLAVEIELSKG